MGTSLAATKPIVQPECCIRRPGGLELPPSHKHRSLPALLDVVIKRHIRGSPAQTNSEVRKHRTIAASIVRQVVCLATNGGCLKLSDRNIEYR